MTRSSTLILIGALTVLAPFSGLPVAWLHILFPLLGLVVIVVGFLIRADRVKAERDSTPPPIGNDLSPIA